MILPRRGSLVAVARFRELSDPVPVHLRGPRRSRLQDVIPERLEAIQAALEVFEREWPLAAASLEYVEIVPELASPRHDDLALADTRVFLGEVFSRIQLSRALVTDPRLDALLESWSQRGDVVAAGLTGLLFHEFGHVLLSTPLLRADPRARSASGAARLVLSRALGAQTTVAYKMDAAKVSKRATLSEEEFVAEAVADWSTRRSLSDLTSQKIVIALAELWNT